MKKILFFFILLNVISSWSQSKELNLMPWPQELVLGKSKLEIQPDFTIVVHQKITKRIEIATTKFLRRLSGRTGVFFDNGFAFNANSIQNATLEIFYKRAGKLEINEDESYQLKTSSNKISIEATTDIGVIYALETLLQLLDNNDTSYYFPEVSINDFPRFTWRGLMIDVARHFHPVDVLKRNLDAMAAVKMNVFHWHLTDDQGFRIESKKHPKLHQLGSDGQYYTQEQIKDVVQYASDRGIRVVPEIDVPGHATAILTAYPEIGSKDTIYSIERFSGIFDPTLDPTNEKTYEILGDLFAEMAELFPDKYFHIGGDENEGKHWDENEHIQSFKKKHNLQSNHDLQTFMNIRLEEILVKLGKSVMGWEEIMTDKMPKSALIHSWKGKNEGVPQRSSLFLAAKKGYNTILSNGYYIDLMQPVSEHYLVDPLPKNNNLSAIEKARVLGGEATMWSELATKLTLDSRLWPRTAAIAERFWSSEAIVDVSNMYKRLGVISFRLEELGITHIRNRDVILRNITNNQNIEALITLAKVYEPLKIYSRNAGGTEYKTYSPFTLFADACTADASDAIIFKELVHNFISSKGENSKAEIVSFFKKWAVNYQQFNQIEKGSPLLKNIAPLSKNLAEISTTFLQIINSETITKEDYTNCIEQLLQIEKPVEDVELAISKDLKKLAAFLIDTKKVSNISNEYFKKITN
ncbi:beta-N-acetylhexosaminidase [Lutibacter maritimus]|uniref:Hexosaminidase n=1 Tax=Lutibacter maritimus TaxID=593133 RepID=A0A1I6PQ13_9FLAO|nr:family 20 glycosylhydrolase [Lutibacter maritimus]SFS42276.1 hexosaminidase [Lutibacter maritimus]